VRIDERAGATRNGRRGAGQLVLIDFDEGDRSRRVPAGGGVDEDENVVPIQQPIGEVHTANSVISDFHAVGIRSTGQLAHDLDAESIVAQKDVPHAGDEHPAHDSPWDVDSFSTGCTSSGAK